MSLETTLIYMYPALVPDVDYVLVSDDAGERIAQWITTAYTEPTAAAINNASPAADLSWAQQQQAATLAASYLGATSHPVSFTTAAGVTKIYQADAQAVQNVGNMLAAYEHTKTPTGFYWVAADNTQVPFTLADLQGLGKAMGDQGWAAFQHLQTKKAAVLAAPSITALEAILW